MKSEKFKSHTSSLFQASNSLGREIKNQNDMLELLFKNQNCTFKNPINKTASPFFSCPRQKVETIP